MHKLLMVLGISVSLVLVGCSSKNNQAKPPKKVSKNEHVKYYYIYIDTVDDIDVISSLEYRFSLLGNELQLSKENKRYKVFSSKIERKNRAIKLLNVLHEDGYANATLYVVKEKI